MADETTPAEEATSEAPVAETQEGSPPAELGDAGKKALDAERPRAKAAEKKAKELETELEEIKRSQMTDQEKAIEEARALARAEAFTEAASDIAVAEFKAANAGRLDEGQLTNLLSGLDVKAFLSDAGKVDTDKIQTFMDGIAPAPGERRPADLGQGARSQGTALNGDPLLRDLKSKLGIS